LFGENMGTISDLQLLRLLRGVSQWELAVKLHIPATRLSEMEHGKRQLSPEMEIRIRKAIIELAEEKDANVPHY
jgi:plasmid maintenance system antidote protein VapI